MEDPKAHVEVVEALLRERNVLLEDIAAGIEQCVRLSSAQILFDADRFGALPEGFRGRMTGVTSTANWTRPSKRPSVNETEKEDEQ